MHEFASKILDCQSASNFGIGWPKFATWHWRIPPSGLGLVAGTATPHQPYPHPAKLRRLLNDAAEMRLMDILPQLKRNGHKPGLIQLSQAHTNEITIETTTNDVIFSITTALIQSLRRELPVSLGEPVTQWPVYLVGKRSIVVVSIDCGLHLPMLMLAVLLSGHVLLPLDPTDPISRSLQILQAALKDEVSILVVEQTRRLSMHPIDGVKVVLLDQLLSGDSTDAQEISSVPRHGISHIYMTSGSSGQPKGCICSHENLDGYLASKVSAYKLNSSKVLIASPHTFDPYLGDILSTWLAGGTVIVGQTRELVWSRLDDCLSAIDVTHVTTTPSVWNRVTPRNVAGLFVALGGEAMSAALVDKWLGKIDLYNTYGVTECCIYQDLARVTLENPTRITQGFPTSPLFVLGNDAVGWEEIPTTPMSDLSVISSGVGEIVVTGAQVGLGYWFEKTRTNRSFVMHPTLGKCFRTGDLVEFTNGSWKMLGRCDSQTKIRGKRVDLLEIASLLTSKFPGVIEEVVVTFHDNSLVAWCRGEAVAAPLIQGLARNVFPAWMVPSIVFPAEFYYTTSGKVDVKRMVQIAIPDEWQDNGGWTHQILACSTMLQLPPWRDFFQVGGDSFTALRLCKQLAHDWHARQNDAVDVGAFGEQLEEFAPMELMKRSALFDYAKYLHHTLGPWSTDGPALEMAAELDVGQVILADAKHTMSYLLSNDLIPERVYPLHLACKAGKLDMARLASNHCSHNQRNLEGLLPLHSSANGPMDLVEFVLGSMTKTTPLHLVLGSLDNRKQTVLHHAARNGVPDSIMTFWIGAFSGEQPTFLPKAKCKVVGIDNCDTFGRSPLHWAVLHGHSSLVSLLLEHGADAKRVDKSNESALDMAERRARCGANERAAGARASVWGDIARRLGGSGSTKNVKKFLE